jgi:hypothetical protein
MFDVSKTPHHTTPGPLLNSSMKWLIQKDYLLLSPRPIDLSRFLSSFDIVLFTGLVKNPNKNSAIYIYV